MKCKDCKFNNTKDCKPPIMDYGEDNYYWYCKHGEKYGNKIKNKKEKENENTNFKKLR